MTPLFPAYMIDPRRLHTICLIGGAATTWYPDPEEFAATAGRSGARSTGTHIFQTDDAAVIWSATVLLDIGTNPVLEIRRKSDGALMAAMSAYSNLLGAHIPFPFFCPSGFYVVATGICSWNITWSRIAERGT
jgi:hypothetical protein